MGTIQKFLKGVLILAVIMHLNSCRKGEDKNTEPIANQFKTFRITRGQHYSDNATYKPLSGLKSMLFTAIFDSTAIYYTASPQNQSDINKLYGFADNNQTHHAFSARIGWRWISNKLELLGYVYNDSLVSFSPIGYFPLNTELQCKIEISNSRYLIGVNSNTITMPRSSQGITATGYQLYPYFGGDETAPHDIYIQIRDN